jgi:hypothetical protein
MKSSSIKTFYVTHMYTLYYFKCQKGIKSHPRPSSQGVTQEPRNPVSGVPAILIKKCSFYALQINNINYNINYIKYFAMESTEKLKDWQELTQLTRGLPLVVERVRIAEKNIAIEGRFELPQLARLPLEDQVFITAFSRSHGSIKEMERVFGISYPTVKSRLTRIADSLEFVEHDPTPSKSEILARLERGEITAEDAIREMEALK